MANATKYVDNVNGNNGNTGDSEVQAYADLATAIAAISGGGNTIHLQNAGSNYVYTATETFTAALKGDSTNGRNKLIGYTTTPGARDGRPIITSATNSVNLFTLNDNDLWDFEHLKFTHTAGTRGSAFVTVTSVSDRIRIRHCVFDGCNRPWSQVSAGGAPWLWDDCEIANGTSTGGQITSPSLVVGCYIHDNAGDGITGSFTALRVIGCIIANNANDGIVDTTASGSNIPEMLIAGNIIVGNGRDGIRFTGDVVPANFGIYDNIIYGNGGYGNNWFNLTAAEAAVFQIINKRNAYGGNSSGARNNFPAGDSDITLTADPFVDEPNADYNINNDAGGGAVLRAVTYSMPG